MSNLERVHVGKEILLPNTMKLEYLEKARDVAFIAESSDFFKSTSSITTSG